MDARGHGDSAKPAGAEPYRWEWFGRDVIGRRGGAVPGARRLERCARAGSFLRGHGVDHRLGRTGTACSSASCWSTRSCRRGSAPELEALRRAHGSSLADGARRRRAVWPSRDAARAKWAGKDLFTGWDPRVFEIYLAEGLHDRSDGQVELACPPEIEAAIFEASGSLDVLELASQVRVPALILWARAGNFPYTHFETLAARMAAAELRVADAGHLVPMENPELVVREVLRFVQRSTG